MEVRGRLSGLVLSYRVGSRDGTRLVSLAHLLSHLPIKESAQLERIFVPCYMLLIIFQKIV